MKLAKLSLAAIVVAGLASSSFAADTLADAFKEGKVSGALKAYYFDRDDGVDDEGILNFGLMLNYKTGSFYGFGLNFTGQTNHAPFADGAVGVDGSKDMFSGDEYGSGAQLSEAYLSYSAGKTTVLVGRMFLDTPLVASSGSRMVKEAFEGAAVINTDLPNTTLIAGYVQKFQARTDGAGNIGEFTKELTGVGNGINKDGAYTLAAINKSITGLTLTGAYADVIDALQVGYIEAAYEGKASSFTYGLAAQYYYNNPDAAAADNSHLYGIKATVGVGAVTGYAAYTTVSKDAGITPGLGGSADLAYTGSVILSNSYAANTDAYKVGVDYAINAQATIGATYTVTDDDDLLGAGNGKISYISLLGSYDFTGALKGFGLGAEYDKGNHDKAGVKDDQEIRIKATYKF